MKTKKPKVASKSGFGTKEWAVKNFNFITGCRHNCKYCFSKANAIRYKRSTPDGWVNEHVREHDLQKGFKKHDGRIMFPSSHDIHPDHLPESIYVLGHILSAGNDVLIVTKPHQVCIERICTEFDRYKKQILFRFTIGSSKSSTLKFWEPGAPSFEERLICLQWAYVKGFKTSISCEPMLDDNVGELIRRVSPYVTDSIWLGKANDLIKRLKLNGAADEPTMKRAQQLIEWQSDERIKDLYNRLKDNPVIKWKESIKIVVGLPVSTEPGMDI